MISRLLATIILSLTTMPAFAAEKFPGRPLVGTFELHSSTPSLDSVDPRDLNSETFQAGQRVRFEYIGEYGSDRSEREVYKIAMLPPFAETICLQPDWSFICPSYNGRRLANDADQPPTHEISHEAYLDIERANTEEEVGLNEQFIPYGFKRGDFIYVMTYTDTRASYVFYFQDWNTIISHGSYNIGNRVPTVIQVLKRVKTP